MSGPAPAPAPTNPLPYPQRNRERACRYADTLQLRAFHAPSRRLSATKLRTDSRDKHARPAPDIARHDWDDHPTEIL